MPYIDPERALEIKHWPGDVQTEGELNFAITNLYAAYLRNNGLSYATINAISGAATESLAEFRRRIVVPYEMHKQTRGADPYTEHRVACGATEPVQAWIERTKKT